MFLKFCSIRYVANCYIICITLVYNQNNYSYLTNKAIIIYVRFINQEIFVFFCFQCH